MSSASQPSIRLRLVALPVEHGGWAFLIAPILLGLWVAPSSAGAWLSLAALGAFLMRQPLKLALGDRQRGKRYPRTAWAERFALLYGCTALLAFIIAWLTTAHPFWQPLLLAAPLATTQFYFDLLRQSRALVAELCGTAAMTGLVAVLALAGGWALGPALVLWVILSLWALTSILYVRVRLRLARGVTARRFPSYLVHSGALVIIAGLAWFGLASWLAVAAFVILLLRSVIGLLPRSLNTPTPIVGVQELVFGLLTVIGIILG